MNGWIESGNYVNFGSDQVKTSDTVFRTDLKDDGIVICNGSTGNRAGMCVAENRVGIGMRPRPFASLDVNGVIFGNDRLELTTGDHPISCPRMVVDPKSLCFVGAPNKAPVTIDGVRGSMVSDGVLAREALGVLGESIPVPLRRVVTTESVATDIEVDATSFHEMFHLDATVCIEGAITKVVQFNNRPGESVFQVTLVPSLPNNIVSDSVVNVTPISKSVTVQQTNERKSYSFILMTKPPVRIDDFTWQVIGKGVEADVLHLVDKYVALSGTKLHNYGKVVIVRSAVVVLDDDGSRAVEITFVAPSLKNPLDVSELGDGNKQLYMYHLSYPDLLWQTEFKKPVAFFVDANKLGYYLSIDDTYLINMMNTSSEMEHLNAIDQVVLMDVDKELYRFKVTKTYVMVGRALLYIDVQTLDAVPDVEAIMFNGVFDVKYRFTGLPFLFKGVKRVDDYTLDVQCEAVQGYIYGDPMTIITSREYNGQYILLNDMTSCVSWRIISAEMGQGVTLRCTEKSVVDAALENGSVPRVVYAVPLKGVVKPSWCYDALTLDNGVVTFRDPGKVSKDIAVRYDGKSLHMAGDAIEVSVEEKALVVKKGRVVAADFQVLADARFARNARDLDKDDDDVEFIRGLAVKEFEIGSGIKKRGILFDKKSAGTSCITAMLPNGDVVEDALTISYDEILMRCVCVLKKLLN